MPLRSGFVPLILPSRPPRRRAKDHRPITVWTADGCQGWIRLHAGIRSPFGRRCRTAAVASGPSNDQPWDIAGEVGLRSEDDTELADHQDGSGAGRDWYALPIERILAELDADTDGLDPREADRRPESDGRNRIREPETVRA